MALQPLLDVAGRDCLLSHNAVRMISLLIAGQLSLAARFAQLAKGVDGKVGIAVRVLET